MVRSKSSVQSRSPAPESKLSRNELLDLGSIREALTYR